MKHLKSYKLFELHQNTYDSYYKKRVLDIIRNKYSDIYDIDYDDIYIDIDFNQIFQIASNNGHLDIVKLLLNDSRVDPSDRNNYAIRIASQYGHTEIVKLLLNDSRVYNKLKLDNNELYKKSSFYRKEKIKKIINEY